MVSAFRVVVGILSFLSFINLSVAQDTLVLPIVKGEYELPLPNSGGQNGWIMSFVVKPGDKISSQKIGSGHQFPIYVPRILSLSEYADGQPSNMEQSLSDTVYAYVFHKESGEGMYFSMDLNKNQDFLDDDSVPILENTPFRYELPTIISSGDGPEKELVLPLKIEYRSTSNELLVTNLLKYDIQYEWWDTTLDVALTLGTYMPNFSFETAAPGLKGHIFRNYLLGEPFLFMNRFWVLQNLNIENNTIELVQFPPKTRPIGYKKGYFVNLDSLFSDHRIPPEVRDRGDSALIVLYFWGTWCQPCIKNMPKTQKIGDLAMESEKLSMFGVSLLKSNQTEKDIREFEKENDIHFPNFVESMDGNFSLIRKLRNISYPNYFLFNTAGKILYRGRKSEELISVLSEFGVHQETEK